MNWKTIGFILFACSMMCMSGCGYSGAAEEPVGAAAESISTPSTTPQATAPASVPATTSLPGTGTDLFVPASVETEQRDRYHLTYPKAYDPNQTYPLAIILPGGGGPAADSSDYWSWLQELSDTYPIIMLAPKRAITKSVPQEQPEQAEKAPRVRVPIKEQWGRRRQSLLQIVALTQKRLSVDPKRIYLIGGSAGADFMCSSNVQLDGIYAGSLAVVPGPPHMLGLKAGDRGLPKEEGPRINRVKDHPFYFITGEFDVRQQGPWQAYLRLESLGGNTMFYSMPLKGHVRPSLSCYVQYLRHLEIMAYPEMGPGDLAIAKEAIARKDWLMASVHLSRVPPQQKQEADALLEKVRQAGEALLTEREKLAEGMEPAEHLARFTRIEHSFYRFPDLARRAAEQRKAFQEAFVKEKGPGELKASWSRFKQANGYKSVGQRRRERRAQAHRAAGKKK